MPHDDYEYVTVHDSAVTNTTHGSKVELLLTVDGPPICENMTDAEFRRKVLTLRDDAVKIITQRIYELDAWKESAQARVREWFGVADESTRSALTNGLADLITVMNGLEAKNFVRSDPKLDRALGCTPNTKNLAGEVAHVCGPDTATHTISITPKFCELPDTSAGTFSSMQLTIVHECVHFWDTFGALDYKNTYGQFLSRRLAKEDPALAFRNADNIAWYILCID
ncbi:M35 family metallo-endopeptidase [Burkholderia lata]|uniref:M35 family metallo-endopeptidase n=1 Tax=Burkholderia lata (strain ATCC 17760 / DSM 23089 / LMG 22485 / NCIMB 9086 / R18194 / 383) TaxID=482957 RepID=UPI001453EEF7|nr:M35 family metallo-endopeptidase [Burkholderia lata]VWC52372.1 peptidase M35 [Burkholderia lata]